MTTVESKDGVGDSADITENADDVSLPEDFFDEFEDSKFLDEIVEIVVPEQARLVRTGDTNENSIETNDDNANEKLTERCLEQINDLTKSIERRKQRLRNNSLTKAKRKRRSHTRTPSPAPTRLDRNVRSRDRRISPAPRTGRRGRSRSRDRNHSRDRRTSRRDRSRSQSTTKHSRTMSFLEELEQKFAEEGKDFPEKDLLIQSRSKKNGVTATNRQMGTVGYPQREMPMSITPYVQMPSLQMPPMYSQPAYQPYWNANYMINPMTTTHMQMQLPLQAICAANDPAAANNVIYNGAKAMDIKPRCNKTEVVARCRAASKILRGEENKVPKLRFFFTRTSLPIDTAAETETLPLQSKKNVEFHETSDNQKPCVPLQLLRPRTSELVKILGYNCSTILSRLRLKNVANKVINEIEDIDEERKRSKLRAFKESETQTDSYKCPTCIVRESKTFSNKSSQSEAPKKVSIRTQTNEKDYRDPLIRQLSRISAGQLVAVSDFINLICEPRPSTSTEIFSVREKLMDIYNLSERGPEAIEAERSRDHESSRRRGYNNNNGSMPSPPMEDLRATIRSSDHNMGRIPPPPPLFVNYHVGMVDPDEVEMRLQQMRYEENMRMMQLEEQRNRELEWEQQQQIVQQQRQMQREQEEENARLLEMRNDHRRNNGFGRGNNHWNDGRGHGRY